MENRLGSIIKQARGDISLREYAKQIGISHSYLSSIESGVNPITKKPISVGMETLEKLSKRTGYSVSYLSGETHARGQKETPAPVSGSGLSEDAIKIGKAFDAAAPELKKLVEAALSGPQTIQADTVAIRITCPIDHTEQVIHQPVYRIDGKTIPERNNNGCEMCRPCEECTLCRLRAAASLL